MSVTTLIDEDGVVEDAGSVIQAADALSMLCLHAQFSNGYLNARSDCGIFFVFRHDISAA